MVFGNRGGSFDDWEVAMALHSSLHTAISLRTTLEKEKKTEKKYFLCDQRMEAQTATYIIHRHSK